MSKAEGTPQVLYQPKSPIEQPLRIFSIEFSGPLPTSSRESNCFLTLVERHSNFPKAATLRMQLRDH